MIRASRPQWVATKRPQSTSGGNDVTEALEHELDHYRERWRATERIVDQRLTMLLAGLGSAIAATVALLARGDTTAAAVDVDSLLGAVWMTLAIVAQGILLRLIRARLTIHRNIAIINHLRAALVRHRARVVQGALQVAYQLDSRLPRPFYIWGSTAACALVQAASTLLAYWFLVPGIDKPLAWYSLVGGVVMFAANMTSYWMRCRRVSYAELASTQAAP